MKDDLSNFVLAYGIRARQVQGIHQGIEGFWQHKEPLYLTLETLGGLNDVQPGWSLSVVYVVENPAVFSALIKACPAMCAVCVNGQPRLAALLLMDLLSAHAELRYAGDFDPEGLLIAQRLKDRYGERLIFWCCDQAYYQRYRMQDAFISAQRLKKLAQVTAPELAAVKDALAACGCAAYQENMLAVYQEQLTKEMKGVIDHGGY